MNDPYKRQRWANIYHAMTGMSSPGAHEQPTGTSDQSRTAGHEPDAFDAKGIILVPVLVVAVTLAAYVIVHFTFRGIEPGKPYDTPTMSPLAIEENRKPFNTRAARISNVDPNAPVKAPRLEGIVVVDQDRPGAIDPVNYRSFAPATKENTYFLTPQDLYPSRFVDPLTGEMLLNEYKLVTKTVARIPIEEAMKLLLKGGMLKSVAGGSTTPGTVDDPKQSNGGQAK